MSEVNIQKPPKPAAEPVGYQKVTLAVAYEARDGRQLSADETAAFPEAEAAFLLATGHARAAN